MTWVIGENSDYHHTSEVFLTQHGMVYLEEYYHSDCYFGSWGRNHMICWKNNDYKEKGAPF